MRWSLFACIPALLVCQPLYAAESPSTSISEAKALVEKIEVERVLDSMFLSLKGLFADNAIAAMTREDSSGNAQSFFNSFPGGRERFAQILGDEFLTALQRQYPEMKDFIAKQYAATFNLEELKALNGFFSTGVGQKWLVTSPKIEKSMGEWGQKAGMKAGAEAFSAAIKRVEAEQSGGAQ